jgi:O-antigen ligase
MLKGKKRLLFISIATLISAAGIFFITTVNSFKVRYIGELKNDLTQVSVNNEILEPRVVRWELAMQLVKKAPLTGYGNGSEKGLLKQLYFDNKLFISYLNEFNAHNQYLSFLLKAGIAGLLIYLYILFFGFALAVKQKDFLFLGFMIIIAVVSVSENILDVNKGIFFYSFFMSLFVLANLNGMFYKRQPVQPLERFDIKESYLKDE